MSIALAPKIGRKALAGQAVFITAALIVAWMVWNHERPERLAEVDLYPFGTIDGGRRYWTGFSSAATPADVKPGQAGAAPKTRTAQVYSEPIPGNVKQLLVDEGPDVEFYSNSALTHAGHAVNYALIPRRKPVVNGGFFGGAGGLSGPNAQYLGEFAASAKVDPRRTTLEPKRVPSKSIPWKGDIVRIHQAPDAGGSGRELRRLQGKNIQLVGNSVFWVRPRPETRVEKHLGNKRWSEVSGHDELMWSALDGGSERCLRSSLTSSATLAAGDSGVMWTEPRPYPDDTKDLYYARAADGKLLSLGRIAANVEVGWSLEWQGSLYWFMNWKRFETGQPYEAAGLMAVNLDNSHLRTVFRLHEGSQDAAYGKNLFILRNHLYCVITEIPSSQVQAFTQTNLARVQFGEPSGYKIVRKLPPNAIGVGADQGYYYYCAPEIHRSLIASLMDEHGGERRTMVMYRIPVPD